MHDVIDIPNLAYRTGSPVAEVREAGRKLFEQISGKDSDLTKALIAASDTSGLEPQQVLLILKVIAEDFRQPLAAEGTRSVPPVMRDLAERTLVKVRTVAEAAREKASSVDLSALKERGEAMADSVRQNLSSVELQGIKGRIVEAGEALVEKAKSLSPASTADRSGTPGMPRATDD